MSLKYSEIPRRAPGCRLFAVVALSFELRAMNLGVLCAPGMYSRTLVYVGIPSS
jgi:hypothetical protein